MFDLIKASVIPSTIKVEKTLSAPGDTILLVDWLACEKHLLLLSSPHNANSIFRVWGQKLLENSCGVAVFRGFLHAFNSREHIRLLYFLWLDVSIKTAPAGAVGLHVIQLERMQRARF